MPVPHCHVGPKKYMFNCDTHKIKYIVCLGCRMALLKLNEHPFTLCTLLLPARGLRQEFHARIP